MPVSYTALGCTTLTRIPSGPASNAATLASCVRPALAAEYAAAPGPGAGTFLEATKTTAGSNPFSSNGRQARSTFMWEPRFNCMDCSQAASVISARFALAGKLPALLTSMSRPPKCSTPWLRADSVASESVTSQRRHNTSGDSRPSISSMSNAMTVAPRPRNSSTVARPMPEAAPVTRAILPCSSGAARALASLACSSSQYSTSNSFSRGKVRHPPMASASRVARIV